MHFDVHKNGYHRDTGRSLLKSACKAYTVPTAGRQPSAKPPSSQLVLGDGRLHPFTSSYAADFHSPFPEQSKLRSPLRSKDARHPHELQGLYSSAMQRIGE